MNDDDRSALVERVGNIVSDSHDIEHLGKPYQSHMDDTATEIIALVRQDERKRIAAALDEIHDQIRTESTDGMGDIARYDSGVLRGIHIAIGITEEPT